MSDPDNPQLPLNDGKDASPADRRLDARRRNEHLKLVAGAFDRISTVILGGAVLAPLFQHRILGWHETVGWIFAAFVLHGMAHYAVGRIREED